MYAQFSVLKVPLDQMDTLRWLVRYEYLPVVRERKGFVAAYLLEQADDPTTAHLIQLWDSYENYEQYRKTTLLSGSEQSIAAHLPGLQIKRSECVVRVSASNHEAHAAHSGL